MKINERLKTAVRAFTVFFYLSDAREESLMLFKKLGVVCIFYET